MHNNFCSRRRLWGVLLAITAAGVPVGAQEALGSVSGRVTDGASGAPLEDARVMIVGTTLATTTNPRGEYRIMNVRPGRVQLSVLRLGYRATSDTLQVAVGQATNKDFALTATLTTLSDVVVTGTVGNQERRAQSATVSSVSAADIKATAAISNVNELLQSRVAGMSVNSASGTAGGARTVRIRGPASISLSNRPLVFIDGVRVVESSSGMGIGGQTTDRLNDINPDDIESIEVVKGPAGRRCTAPTRAPASFRSSRNAVDSAPMRSSRPCAPTMDWWMTTSPRQTTMDSAQRR
jgi:hypothetical protein